MSEEEYRIFHGVAYPKLYSTKNNKQQPTQITSDLSNPESFYFDEAIVLTDEDAKEFVGKDICCEHNINASYGKISAAWRDSEGKMRISARIFTGTAKGKEFWNKINNKTLNGLSVGYSVSQHNGQRIGKHFREVSACEQGFFPGAEIKIAATNKKKRENNNHINTLSPKKKKYLVISASMEEKKNLLEEQNKDGSELAKHHDELLKKNEEMQKKLVAMQEMETKMKHYEAMEMQRREQYKKNNEPALKEVLEITKEQLKEQKGGVETEVPTDYRQSLETAFSLPEAQENMAVIVASAKAWKKEREEKKQVMEKLADYELKMKKYEENQSVLMTHVEASKRLHLATGDTTEPKTVPKEISVNASKTEMNMSQLFVPQPSQQECILYQMETGKQLNINVNASATTGKTLPPLPEHNWMAFVPHGMRNHPSAKFIFSHILNNNFDKVNIPVKENIVISDE